MRTRALTAALFVSVVLTAAPARADGPIVTLTVATLTPGQSAPVSGTGWEPGDIVQVQICGNDAARGSSDCDQQQTTAVGVRADSAFYALVAGVVPPVPCPCVVRATSSTGMSATTPVQIPGVAVMPIVRSTVPEVARSVQVSDLEISDDGNLSAWFGGPPHRTLHVTVVNNGTVAIDDPPISLAVGRGSHPTGIVETVPSLGRLEPGESTEVRIPIELPAFAFGSYTVAGEINGFGAPLEFETETSAYPWGLILIPCALIVHALLMRIRTRVRRRLVQSGRVPVVIDDAETFMEVREAEDEPTEAGALSS